MKLKHWKLPETIFQFQQDSPSVWPQEAYWQRRYRSQAGQAPVPCPTPLCMELHVMNPICGQTGRQV